MLDKSEQPVRENDSVVEAISGNLPEADKAWIAENIASIKKAVASGKHDRVFYPACGQDLLRILSAYDPEQIIAVDTDDQLVDSISQQFERAGIDLSIADIDGVSTRMSCQFMGKNREIIFINQDARVSASMIDHESVDVLHIFLPTGADQESTVDTSISNIGQPAFQKNDKHPLSPVKSMFSARNYFLVSEGGFMIFDEKRINPFHDSPRSLLKIAGIEEVAITRRHPLTVSTSFYPTPEELKGMDRGGFIYHKTRSVSELTFNSVLAALDVQLVNDYVLMEIRRGGFEYLEIQEGQSLPQAIQYLSKDYFASIGKVALEMLSSGVEAIHVYEYALEQKQIFITQLSRIKDEFQRFILEYKNVASLLSESKINQEQALSMLGVGKGKYSYESKTWPIALKYLRKSREDGYDVAEMVEELANLDLSIISAEVDLSLAEAVSDQ